MRPLIGAKSTLLICLISALLVSACGSSDPEPRRGGRGGFSRAIPVVTIPVVQETLRDELQAVGTARALQSVNIFPESAGVVTAVNFTADQAVIAGTVLLELDARDETLALQLAEVQRDDAALQVKRFESVNFKEANIPESELDTARATLKSADIAVRQAEIALERRSIRAPFSGRVGITDIDVGDRIDTATMVTTLDDRSTLLVDFPVPETFVTQIAPGTGVSVQLWETSKAATPGEIVAVDSRIDPASRAFTARAGVLNGSDTLRPGMAFEIAVPVSRGDYLAVPDVSVQWGADGPYVWVDEENAAKRVSVKLVRRLAGRLLIEGDLFEGTRVIAEGVQAVREGLALRVMDADALDRDARMELAQPTEEADSSGPADG